MHQENYKSLQGRIVRTRSIVVKFVVNYLLKVNY